MSTMTLIRMRKGLALYFAHFLTVFFLQSLSEDLQGTDNAIIGRRRRKKKKRKESKGKEDCSYRIIPIGSFSLAFISKLWKAGRRASTFIFVRQTLLLSLSALFRCASSRIHSSVCSPSYLLWSESQIIFLNNNMDYLRQFLYGWITKNYSTLASATAWK